MKAELFRILSFIDHTWLYRALLYFYGLYPVVMSLVWVVLSVFFRTRQEDRSETLNEGPFPFVSIVVPAYTEEDHIERTLDALLAIDYPEYEVVVVNDGSPDRTAEIVREYTTKGRIRLLDKLVNEGKAMALNDALVVCRGEILLFIDADIVATPQILKYMVPHFRSGRVAAVTGNPRVRNRDSFLQNLQAIEFSSIISMQRRAQRIWGRVMTVSGAVAAFRRSAIFDCGLFSPEMATEDIDMSWRVQMKFWDIRYEPRAVVWMEAPPTVGELWKQRRRWARGLAQVLRRHSRVPLKWVWRRLWPVFYESTVSILWAYTFVGITLYWLVCLLAGYVPHGASPIPNFWGMLIATACIVQLFLGAWADFRYDSGIFRSAFEAIFYPLAYWTLMSFITTLYTFQALLISPTEPQRWKIRRQTE